MKVLVTGGAGFIGSHLVEALLKRGETVRILDDLSTGKVENLKEATGCPVPALEGQSLGPRRITLGKQAEFIWRSLTDPKTWRAAGEIRHSLSSIRQARAHLGYEPRVDFQDGLAATWEWFRKDKA